MQQQTKQPSQDFGQLLAGVIEGLARSIALTVEVFLHRDFGARYVDCGFAGILVIFFFAGWFPDQNPRFLYGYMVAYAILWLIAGVSALKRTWGVKNSVHSRYTGRPYLWRLLPNWKEENVKHLEALAVIFLGYGVHQINRPLGDYLMMAASLVFLRGYNLTAQRRERAVQMNDAVIEQQLVAERFRDMQVP